MPRQATHPVGVRGPSERLLRAAAMFGIGLAPGRCGPPAGAIGRARHAAMRLDRALCPGGIALVVGPSGAGKSLLLGELARRLGPRALRIDAPLPGPTRRAALVDASPLPLESWLRCLAHAGLGEPRLLPCPVDQLSEGQRWRARLALAMGAAMAGSGRAGAVTILADEFTSSLDRLTARGVATAAARWVRAGDNPQSAVRLVAATAHDDLLEVLAPEVVVHVPLDAPPEVLTA